MSNFSFKIMGTNNSSLNFVAMVMIQFYMSKYILRFVMVEFDVACLEHSNKFNHSLYFVQEKYVSSNFEINCIILYIILYIIILWAK
jgi:hypothetical protein